MTLKTKKASVNKHLYGEKLIGEELITTRKHQAKPPSPALPIERVFNLGTTQVSPASDAHHRCTDRLGNEGDTYTIQDFFSFYLAVLIRYVNSIENLDFGVKLRIAQSEFDPLFFLCNSANVAVTLA